MSPRIEVGDLRTSYGQREILRGVDLDVRQGETLALLGPNGAGKSTTMEILEGLRGRGSGTVRVLGRDPESADDAWRGRIGVVLQTWRDHRDWTVGSLLRHTSLYHEKPADLEELAERIALTDFLGQKIRHLSGGQRRRMDLALALVGRPEILFMDEPTVGLDPEARRAFHDVVSWVAAEEGVTTLFTTHDMAEADRLSDRIAILTGGRVTFTGTREEFSDLHGAGDTSVRWTEGGRSHRELTSDPSALITELRNRLGSDVPGLEVRRQNLEDCYLAHVQSQKEASTA